MSTFHVLVSIANLVVLAAFITGISMRAPNLLAFGVVGGYFANLLAIVVAFVLVVILAIRALSGTARSTLQRQWLGLVNGAAVVAAWSIYFIVGKMSWN